MTTNQPVLVAFDGSDHAIRALRWAVDHARLTHDRLRVVVIAMPVASTAPFLRDYEESFATSAAALARDITRHGGVEADVEVHRGWTIPTLVDEAKDAPMVVVGSQGHSALENQWLGSVSQHLAGHAPCPVAVVREAADPSARRILVGIDGSESSQAALRLACERAELTHEEVVAVHCYQLPSVISPAFGVRPEDVEMRYVDEAERLVSDLVAGTAAEHPDVQLRATAVVGRPARTLVDLSASASLVVVGSRGRNPFFEILLGSVAQETLHRAACSVVVVR